MRPPVLLAVDGNSLVHRSFHALAGSGLRSADGRPTWAVRGFCSQLFGALERIGADAVVVGFDDSTTSARKTRWPEYKATRKPKPVELVQQIADTIALLRQAGVAVVVPDGLEADDVLASAARTAAAAGWETVLVTSDRDAFALVDETTSVLRLINGGVDVSPLLNRKLLHILVQVHAHQYREYAALRGDTSDNLTGVHGIGAKTAAKLLAEFETVDEAFADADAGGGRVIKALGRAAVGKLLKPDSRQVFRRNVEIMTMHRDLELGLDLAGQGHGCLPLDTHRLATALRAFTLSAVEPAALRALARAAAAVPAGVLPAVTGALPLAPEPSWQETLF